MVGVDPINPYADIKVLGLYVAHSYIGSHIELSIGLGPNCGANTTNSTIPQEGLGERP